MRLDTDEDLLLNRALTISQLGGTAVPLVFAFGLAPAVFVAVHFCTLIRYDVRSNDRSAPPGPAVKHHSAASSAGCYVTMLGATRRPNTKLRVRKAAQAARSEIAAWRMQD